MTKQNITLDDYESFKLAYFKAIEEGNDVFTFKGQDVLVTYAKYALEYLEQQKPKQ